MWKVLTAHMWHAAMSESAAAHAGVVGRFSAARVARLHGTRFQALRKLWICLMGSVAHLFFFATRTRLGPGLR